MNTQGVGKVLEENEYFVRTEDLAVVNGKLNTTWTKTNRHGGGWAAAPLLVAETATNGADPPQCLGGWSSDNTVITLAESG